MFGRPPLSGGANFFQSQLLTTETGVYSANFVLTKGLGLFSQSKQTQR